jgi:1-acyl-sn-glycerol-3-phosphate acyltransferase
VDVVPLAVSYDPPEVAWIGDDTFVPHFLRLTARPRTLVRLAFGAPIASRAHPDSASLARITHDRIADLLVRRTPWLKTQP